MPPLHPFDEAEPLSFAQLDTLWAQDYPGSSHTTQTLRHDLVHADLQHRRARSLLAQLHFDLHSTGLPYLYWDRVTKSHVRFFEEHAARAQYQFRRAFRLLHSLKPVAPLHAVKSAAAPPPEPEPIAIPNSEKAMFDQHVRVTIDADGQVQTAADPPAAFFLRSDVRELGRSVRRHYYFRDQIVPEPYAFVLEHNGTVHPPAHHVFITYLEADFHAICQREIDTNSPFLLDGPRRTYWTRIEIPYVEFVYDPPAIK